MRRPRLRAAESGCTELADVSSDGALIHVPASGSRALPVAAVTTRAVPRAFTSGLAGLTHPFT